MKKDNIWSRRALAGAVAVSCLAFAFSPSSYAATKPAAAPVAPPAAAAAKAMPTIVSVANPHNIDVESGTMPVLPKTVKATMSDGTVVDKAVTWSAPSSADYYKSIEGDFEALQGTVDGYAKKVELDIFVEPAIVFDIQDFNTRLYQVESGITPELPATTKVTWSNGQTTNETVKWDLSAKPYRLRAGGYFIITGTVLGKHKVHTNLSVYPATIDSIVNDVDVTTTVGQAPKLPEHMSVIWSNADVTSEPVVWNKIDAKSYAKTGTFKVEGTIKGTADPAEVTVTVKAAPVAPVAPATPAEKTPAKKDASTQTPAKEDMPKKDMSKKDMPKKEMAKKAVAKKDMAKKADPKKVVKKASHKAVSHAKLAKTGAEILPISIVSVLVLALGIGLAYARKRA